MKYINLSIHIGEWALIPYKEDGMDEACAYWQRYSFLCFSVQWQRKPPKYTEPVVAESVAEPA